MIRSTIASASFLVMSASVYAGDANPAPSLGDTMSMPALAIIGAVGLIAGIRYLRNRRS